MQRVNNDNDNVVENMSGFFLLNNTNNKVFLNEFDGVTSSTPKRPTKKTTHFWFKSETAVRWSTFDFIDCLRSSSFKLSFVFESIEPIEMCQLKRKLTIIQPFEDER